MHPNSVSAQRARLLDQLRQGPVSTLDARAVLDVMHPAARVMELREQGYQIETLWSREPSPCGRLHRVARYVLLPSNDAPRLPLRFRQAVGSSRRVAQ
ncbi:helix-turn-helix domain-containing protein [Lacisediminimonas profundi]|uniref:helix-turn-helix domain-containing protein n=1 Tax=Lacisediminimonas profundi TaxID=2603856 RepID=UPI00124B10DE|nr:helix-turn-helix domain-containing protein [Lacisediminimonas profundi]